MKITDTMHCAEEKAKPRSWPSRRAVCLRGHRDAGKHDIAPAGALRQQAVGIFSERDFARKESWRATIPATPWSAIMTRGTLRQPAEHGGRMHDVDDRGHFRHLPVLEARLCGPVSIGDSSNGHLRPAQHIQDCRATSPAPIRLST